MKYKLLYKDSVAPTRKHETDAGMDVYARGNYLIKPYSYKIIHTGIAVETPPDCMTLIKPKSRSNYLVGGGVVDYGYTGEVLIKVINPYGEDIMVIRHGEPVAQLIVIPVWIEDVEEIKKFTVSSARGDAGGIVQQTNRLPGIEQHDPTESR